MILMYPFREIKEKIRLFSHFEVNENILNLSFIVDDFKNEIEDLYPLTDGFFQGKIFSNENLWQTTCFEIFLKNQSGDDYYEFNFNAKGDWNVFYFSKYRERVTDFNHSIQATTSVERKLNRTHLLFGIDLSELKKIKWPCLVNVSAVIKSKSENSYWSHKHNSEKPDFHDPNNFSLKLNLKSISSEGRK